MLPCHLLELQSNLTKFSIIFSNAYQTFPIDTYKAFKAEFGISFNPSLPTALSPIFLLASDATNYSDDQAYFSNVIPKSLFFFTTDIQLINKSHNSSKKTQESSHIMSAAKLSSYSKQSFPLIYIITTVW